MKRLNVQTMVLELTRQCNLECKHCFRGDSRNEYMNTKIIDLVFKNSCRINSLLLTGGEPLLAVEQLKRIRDNILKDKTNVGEILVVTNGTILTNEIIQILKDIETRTRVDIRLSTDAFHLIEIKDKGLLETKSNNIKTLKRLFNVDISYPKVFVIDRVGKAVNLTEEDMDYVNKLDNTKYVIGNSKILEEYRKQYPLPILKPDNVVDGTLNIDVHGNITPTYYSYEAEDKHSYSNINKGLTLAINDIKL